jgi:hypothetical protein
MANEITLNSTLSYAKGAITTKTLGVTGKGIDVSGTNYVQAQQPITTSATALDISNLTTLGFAIFRNNDNSNSVDLMTSTSGAHFATLLPGEIATFRFPSAVTAPAAIATGGTVNIEFLIIES